MKKKHAIKVLQKQLDKIQKVQNLNSSWVTQTKSYLIEFFGKDSEQYSHFIYFFNKKSVDPNYHEYNYAWCKRFLNDCIEVLRDIGVKKEEKKNILSRIPDWSIIPIVMSLLFIGGVFGRYQKDVAFIRMEEKLIKLQDSLSTTSTNKIPDKVKQVDSEKKN